MQISSPPVLLDPDPPEHKLNRSLSALANFCIGFTEVAALSSVCQTLGFGIVTGGSATLIWSFFVNFLMTIIIGLNMAELCAAYPSAGAVYCWAGQVTPEKWAPLAAYVTGWSNFIGNAAGDASFAVGCASFFSAMLRACGNEGLSVDNQVLLSLFILWTQTGMNFFRVDQIGWVTVFAAVVHVGSIFIIVISCLSMTPRLSTATFVFTDFYNDSGFKQPSYVTAVGITSAIYAFTGYEASAHMAEETGNAAEASSMGLLKTIAATGIAGLIILLCLLFSVDDLYAVTNDDGDVSTGNAAVNLFVIACGQGMGAFLAFLVTLNLFFAGLSSVAVTGRITFALARNGAFPHSEMLAVTANSGVPVNSLIMVCVIDSFLLLLPLDQENGLIAFTAIVGLCVIGFQISYGIPILLRLIFRSQLPITSMSLGMWSLPCSVISCLWIFGTATLLFFPVQYPIEAKTFNWLILIVGFVVLIGTLNWRYNSRYTFKGPKRYVEQQPCDTSTVPNPIRAGGEAGDSNFVLTINVGQSILGSPRNMGAQRNFDHKYQRPSQS